MTKSEQANSKDKQTGQTKKGSKKLVAGAAFVIVALYAILIGIATWHPSLHGQRVKFGTENGLTLAIVLTVIAQVIINREQWDVMERQRKLSRQAMRYSEAAYVTVNRAQITKKPIIGQVTEAMIEFINSGNTPAYETRMYLHFGIRPEGFMFTREEAAALPGGVSSAIMGGHGATLKQAVQSRNVLAQEHLDMISEGEYIHVWGIVLYKDIFKRDRWLRFSMALPNLSTTLFNVSPTCNDAGGED